MSVKTFQVKISQEILDDLRERLAKTRRTDEVSGAEWDYGTNLAYLKKLVKYWQDKFDCFAEWEETELIAKDIRAFFRPLRESGDR